MAKTKELETQPTQEERVTLANQKVREADAKLQECEKSIREYVVSNQLTMDQAGAIANPYGSGAAAYLPPEWTALQEKRNEARREFYAALEALAAL